MQGRNPRCPPLVSADTFDPTSPLNVVTVKAGTVVITTVESVITMIVAAAQLQPPRPQHTLQDLERFAHNRHLSIWVRICGDTLYYCDAARKEMPLIELHCQQSMVISLAARYLDREKGHLVVRCSS